MTGWTDRKARSFPTDWDDRVRLVVRRAGGRCECTGSCGAHADRCRARGQECDHALANTDHRVGSLRWLCVSCHLVRTQRQAADGVRAVYAKTRHPLAGRKAPGVL